jgi:DnaJ-class molecular chaperone
MEYRDYYKILGVPKAASAKEIKAAYRKLARKHHPDLNHGNKQAEARFKEINEAHEVLSDPEKRGRYDQLGADWGSFRPGTGGGAGGWPGGVHVRTEGFGGQDMGGFSDFFRTFFSGGARGGEDFFSSVGGMDEMTGANLEQAVDLTLEEVLHGTARTLAIGGAHGRRRFEVKIPAGVKDGSRVRVAGEGGASARGGGPRGDLYLRVRVLPDARFERREDDLQTTVSVPLTTAILGGEAQVPTLDGPRAIKVPAGTPSGRTFRLRGLGLPRLSAGGGRGDLLAALTVTLPDKLSARERELFEELRGSGR